MTEIKQIPTDDPRLGRIVQHDPRSRAYAFKAPRRLELVSKRHRRWIPVLDQGYLGSCTGNAGIGNMGSDPFYHNFTSDTLLDESAAIKLYSDATVIDEWEGSYPPDDTGSSGLAIAKVLKGRGWISGYQHTFTFDDMKAALQNGPVLLGINWYNNFYDPSYDGELTVASDDSVAGGHEIVVDEIDVENKRIWITNSWGENWGVDGRAWFSWETMERLLHEDGDVVVLVPIDQPAPQPTPSEPTDEAASVADEALWEAVKVWANSRRYGENRKATKAVKEWAAKKGLTN